MASHSLRKLRLDNWLAKQAQAGHSGPKQGLPVEAFGQPSLAVPGQTVWLFIWLAQALGQQRLAMASHDSMSTGRVPVWVAFSWLCQVVAILGRFWPLLNHF